MEISEETFIKIKEFTGLALIAMPNVINGSSLPERNDLLSCIKRIHIKLRKETTKG